MNGTRKIIYALLLPLFAILSAFYLSGCKAAPPEQEVSDKRIKAEKEAFYEMKEDGKWTPIFLKGVNMGLTLPDSSLDNPDIPYDVYMEWFHEIKAMNANTIKIFTIMNSDFYSAFYDFNMKYKENGLYLLQGIWINENDMAELKDAYGGDGKILNHFKRAAVEIVDIIHGNLTYPAYDDVPEMIYDKDISPYVAGFILGLEWDPYFVQNTNRNNEHKKSYQGTYLGTSEHAEAFEAFLCETGDTLITHEMEGYQTQHPIAFLNWATTDTISHPDEPFEEEDLVSINTENILPSEDYEAGLFAAVDVYPYYPEFMNVQRDYIKPDKDGSVNSFRAYLNELKQEYSVPLIIAEFGVPSSRGRAHEGVSGYHQGYLTEEEQGTYTASMMNDIYDLGLAGGMIFSWQDEWFKRTWNIQNVSPQKAWYSNIQSAEQHYGIAAYEPGEERVCTLDGDREEWSGQDLVSSTGELALYAKSDERYLYLMAEKAETEVGTKDFGDTPVIIPLNITDGRGNSSYQNLSFYYPADFVITIGGKEDSRILVSSNYDIFYYTNAYIRGNIEKRPEYEQGNSGIFNPMMLLTANPFTLPYSGEEIPMQSYETGLLRFGNGDPEAENYDSLADFIYTDNCLEIRLPWNLLNILDPASCLAVDDIYQNEGILLTEIKNIVMGITFMEDENKQVIMEPFAMEGYDKPKYHKRLKKSYDILTKELKKLNGSGWGE